MSPSLELPHGSILILPSGVVELAAGSRIEIAPGSVAEGIDGTRSKPLGELHVPADRLQPSTQAVN